MDFVACITRSNKFIMLAAPGAARKKRNSSHRPIISLACFKMISETVDAENFSLPFKSRAKAPSQWKARRGKVFRERKPLALSESQNPKSFSVSGERKLELDSGWELQCCL